jgi:hypothetical protein
VRAPELPPVDGLFEAMLTPSALHAAYRRAAKGKRRRADVARFAWNEEAELCALADALRDGTWQPGGYQHFERIERKRRIISVAPFRDRVVHHLLMAAVEPVLEARMYPHSYACRRGKGTHAAVDWYQRLSRRYAWVVKLDLAQYFASIDHALLKAMLRESVADARVLTLLDRVIDSHGQSGGRLGWSWPDLDLVEQMQRRVGLPIGNLSSQLLANAFLSRLDWQLAARPGVGGYLRYVDDLVLLGDDKRRLWAAVDWLDAALAALRLRRHARKLLLQPTRLKLDLLGYQIGRQRRWLRNVTAHAAVRRLRTLPMLYRQGLITLAEVRQRIAAWQGHAGQADALGLRRAILRGLVFQRG